MSDRDFGHIRGQPVGSTFESRKALHDAGVHRPLRAGISGSQLEGADSVVLSGGYEDDADKGESIIYTGHGGNDPESKKQVRDQELVHQNAALVVSHEEQLPVRVVRGVGGDPKWSPRSGYRYDGLFYVTEYWDDIGKSGFKVWRFKLERLRNQSTAQTVSYEPQKRPRRNAGPTLREPAQTRRDTFICVICRVRRPIGQMLNDRKGICHSCRDKPRR